MHRIPFVSIPLLVLLAPALAAQEAVPKPSPELQKFAPQIGTWEGSGTVKHGADGPEAKWTATTSARWVLGGFAVREDTRVDFDGMEQPLVMVTLFGWDGENKRPVALTASNLGAVGMTEVHWGASGERITADVQQMAGKLVVARWVHRIDGDTCHLSCQEAADDGAFYTHVDGTMTRKSEKPSDVTLVDAAFMPEYAQSSVSHFERLKPAAGTYEMKGWFKMGPGAPKTDFSGTDEYRMVFGGSVFEVTSKGQPGKLRGHRLDGLGRPRQLLQDGLRQQHGRDRRAAVPVHRRPHDGHDPLLTDDGAAERVPRPDPSRRGRHLRPLHRRHGEGHREAGTDLRVHLREAVSAAERRRTRPGLI